VTILEKKGKKIYKYYFLTDVIICDFAEDFCHWEVEASDEASGFFFSRVTSEDLQKIGIAGPEESHLGTMANFSSDFYRVKAGKLYQRFKINQVSEQIGLLVKIAL
jgi:hypothetical protein